MTDVYRVDLEFHGLDHSGPSYEGRVFINNAEASIETPMIIENGYAGSFHIFGHGGCFGGMGHCRIKSHNKPFDIRPSHPLTPIYKRLEITNFLTNSKTTLTSISVTIVPKVANGLDRWFVHMDLSSPIKLDKIILKTYR